jgi:hypothetical protein|tara:strand:- start:114 stop:398 length:285 start_codon:yes stop_codon:yes gene_type:complete
MTDKTYSRSILIDTPFHMTLPTGDKPELILFAPRLEVLGLDLTVVCGWNSIVPKSGLTAVGSFRKKVMRKRPLMSSASKFFGQSGGMFFPSIER